MSSAEVPQYVSVQDYLAAEESARTKSEYVDGWVRAMTGTTNRHNRVKLNCLVSLSAQLKGHVCRSTEPQCAYQEEPVLIIEVLSPSTRRYDLEEKMDPYLSIPSLECYVVLEQHQPIAVVLTRTEDGFSRKALQGTHQTIDLPFLNGSLYLSDIYRGVEFTETCVQEPDPEYC